MARTSTNALTARYCTSVNWPCETVQSWRGKVRHDLFGIADSVILSPTGILWVQNCSYGTLKAHRDEIDQSPHLAYLDREGIRLTLWEWRKKKVERRGLWFVRVQVRHDGKWCDIGPWSKPLDLYPKKS